MRNLVMVLLSVVLLVGCAVSEQPAPRREVEVGEELDTLDEEPDETLPEDDSDLELDVGELTDEPEETPGATVPGRESTVDLDALDLDLEEEEDEELPEELVEEQELD